MKAILFAAASVLALSATAASAAIVCNEEGECWHRNGMANYGPDLRLTVHPDNWKWAAREKYKWREHGGHGYWRKGAWIEIK